MAETAAKKNKKVKEEDAAMKDILPVGEAGIPEKKRHPVRNTMLFTSLFFVVLILAVIALFRLGGRDSSGDFQYWLDSEGVIRGPIWLFLNPEEMDRDEIYAGEIADVYERDAELDEKEAELDLREAALDARETILDDREDYISAREDQVNEWIEAFLENSPQGILNSYDISDIAKPVAGMNPRRAALMLMEMEEEQILQILLALKPADAGKIIDYLEPDLAAAALALVFEEDDFSYPDTRPGAFATPAPPASQQPAATDSPSEGPSEEPLEEPGAGDGNVEFPGSGDILGV